MFYNLPQGIVSGLAPIPRYKEGGFVNPIDYRAGGTVQYPIGMETGTLVPQVFESGDQQINEALNTMLTTAMPTGATAMPTGDASTSLPMEEPTGAVEELLPESETKDPSSKERLFIVEVNEQKKVLQETIEKVVAEKSEGTVEDPIALKTEITDFINKADSLFKRKVTDIANKLNVQVMPEQITLLTDEFATKLETMFPNIAALEPDDTEVATTGILTMEEGNVVPDPYVQKKIEKQKRIIERLEKLYEIELEKGDRGIGGGTSYLEQAKQRLAAAKARLKLFEQEGTTAEIVKQELFKAPYRKELYESELGSDSKSSEEEEEKEPPPPQATPFQFASTEVSSNPDIADLLARNAESIRRAGLMAGKSKQSGFSGFFDVLGQAQLLGDKAARESLLKQYEIDTKKDIFRQGADIDLFNRLAVEGVDGLDSAKEQFLLAGKEIPSAYNVTHPKGIRESDGKQVNFRDYYIAAKSAAQKANINKTYSEIEADFNKLPMVEAG